MKAISRDHRFENRLTLVEKGRKYFYLFHEKGLSIRIEITDSGRKAFQSEDWDYFIKKEAEYFGGTFNGYE